LGKSFRVLSQLPQNLLEISLSVYTGHQEKSQFLHISRVRKTLKAKRFMGKLEFALIIRIAK
jgi:hypothetical protein